MLEQLEKAYLELEEKIWGECYTNESIQVVVKMPAHTFAAMCYEDRGKFIYYYCDEIGMYIMELCSQKTPIEIDNSLPDDMKFVIMLRKDYENEEIRKLHNKFHTMFDD